MHSTVSGTSGSAAAPFCSNGLRACLWATPEANRGRCSSRTAAGQHTARNFRPVTPRVLHGQCLDNLQVQARPACVLWLLAIPATAGSGALAAQEFLMSHQAPCLRHVRMGTPVSIKTLHAGHAEKPFTLQQLQNTQGMVWSAVAWLPSAHADCHCAMLWGRAPTVSSVSHLGAAGAGLPVALFWLVLHQAQLALPPAQASAEALRKAS